MFEKKQVKKTVLGTFWKFLTKKMRFLYPSKLKYVGAKGALRITLRPKSAKNGCLSRVPKVVPFGSVEDRIPEEKAS